MAHLTTPSAMRLHDYYLQGGDIVFRVENFLFRIHSYFFVRESPYFREKLPHPSPPGSISYLTSDDNPFVLDGVSSTDFQRFLWVFYNPELSIYNASIEEWESILRLAHLWQFHKVKALAVRHLENIPMDAVQRVVLYVKNDVDESLLIPPYAELTIRESPISLQEGRQLGIVTALRLAQAREIARSPQSPKGHRITSPVSAVGPDLDSLIKNVFEVSTRAQGADEGAADGSSTATEISQGQSMMITLCI
ncbi:hypothetical protein HETIRDRAFT_329914 [Heterobasidion irregulare TC 32-1]|uniref:BTB domain-containing protein n=1 Tax=Heterobasidion irregulare (strain TC 32-1) TaxID=747525 RepID=W4JRD4_HETIT|nr:uncharacterized protein HETIRDRAFT_329914 [Heterobasidion irregulare TC 32-1]ETW76132.1 hypothetical protein HETIRDRAFT_329914 [Heterobasidion irregulare TC 32-1]